MRILSSNPERAFNMHERKARKMKKEFEDFFS